MLPLPASKLNAATRPDAATLVTVTLIAVVVVDFLPRPAPGGKCVRAVGHRSAVPGDREGAVVSFARTFVPSTMNWTPKTPTLSDAVALSVTLPLTLLPAAGLVRDTDGAIVSTAAVTVAAAWLDAGPTFKAAISPPRDSNKCLLGRLRRCTSCPTSDRSYLPQRA